MLATLTPAPLSSSSPPVNEMSDTNQLMDEESATMDFKKHIVKEPQHHEPEPQLVEPQSQESASDTPVEQPVCYVNEPSSSSSSSDDDEELAKSKKNEGKKLLYLATDADEPYVSDTSDNLFFAPASPAATAQLAPIEIEPGDERWQEYIADDWERAMPAVADPPTREATEPSPRASTGYSLPGASLSNAVHAMPRPYDLTHARAGATLEDLLNDGATTEADDNDDGDGANDSDPGSDVHVEADWVRLWHQKPVNEWSEQETQFFRNVMGATAVRAQEDRDRQLKKAEELRQRMEAIKELRRSRLRQLSGPNAVGGEGETRGGEGAKEAGERVEALMLTRMQKRALKKREAAKKRRAERKREAGEEAKRKAALAAAAVAIVTVTTAAVAKKVSIAAKSTEATQEESATQQKPAPVTQETTATETPAEQARGGENSSGSQKPENVAKPTNEAGKPSGAAKVSVETGIVDQPGRNNVKPEDEGVGPWASDYN
ncbi:hypothetical protein MPH_06224 [Macrophomina phaseolina MS6]|uniref:Uncharacterized protein n=1 Tax=Macrophomina phaseolina (strain MS6) TaxID=1126212 RepID=K2RNY6_MACPH|nr:hypothetical protein MPH_06224 [Macrophomina phaseolina MS6]